MKSATPPIRSPFASVRKAIWHDLLVVALAVLLAGLLFVYLELTESLFALTRRWEALQIDELPAIMLVLATCLCWFSWRRYREARAELQHRHVAEERLAALLRENRRLAQEYLHGQERERKYLARELHDELGQYLNAIKTDAVSLQKIAEGPALLRATDAINRHVDYLYEIVRNLIRELRPVALDELGLKAALEHYLDQCRQRMPQTRFSVSLQGDLDSLDESTSLVIYRLMQEGITNISRHANAEHVVIGVARRGPVDSVTLSISDDGCGADMSVKPAGLGLIGMRERVETLGGNWFVETQPGKGFNIVASIPLDKRALVDAAS